MRGERLSPEAEKDRQSYLKVLAKEKLAREATFKNQTVTTNSPLRTEASSSAEERKPG